MDRHIDCRPFEVRALLDGRKTMTRRLAWREVLHDSGAFKGLAKERKPSPWQKVKPGDRLWVRENHRFWQPASDASILGPPMCAYDVFDTVHGPVMPEADRERLDCWLDGELRPSIHMPRWASRLTLLVEAVKVERLRDILHADAIAEGVEGSGCTWKNYGGGEPFINASASFMSLWDSLHGPGAWKANPEVVAITFSVEKRNIDALELANG